MISTLLLGALAASAPSARPLPLAPETALVSPVRAALVPADDDKEKYGVWTGSVNVGATWTAGNTAVTTLSAGADAQYREEKYRHTLKGWWNYTSQEDSSGNRQITQRQIGGKYKYDYFATDRLYFNGLFGVEADKQANIDLRWYVGGGPGYQIFQKENREMSGELGLVYFSEDYTNGDSNNYLAARAAYSYWNQINANVRVEQDAEAFPSVEKLADFYGRLDTRVKVKVSDHLFAQIEYVFDYDNTPAPGAQRDDHRVVLGLGWTF